MDEPGEKINFGKRASRFWSRLLGKLDEAVVSLTTRAFLFAFLPVCAALIASLLATQKAVQEGIREDARDSLRLFERHLQHTDFEEEQRSYRSLTTLARNSELVRAMELLQKDPSDQRRREIQETFASQWERPDELLGHDFFILTDAQGQTVLSQATDEKAIPLEALAQELWTRNPSCGYCHTLPALLVGQTLYHAETVPIQGAAGILGAATIGKKFDIRSLTPLGNAVVESKGKVLLTTFPSSLVSEIENGLGADCPWGSLECELKIGGETYHAMRVNRANLWGSYRLLAFHPLNQEREQFLHYFNRIFYGIGAGSLILVLLLSAVGSYFLARPIVNLITHLRQSEQTGQLQPTFPTDSLAKEVNLLARSLNGAARSVQRTQEQLTQAYLEFLEAMA
ncbi:MAG: hypothetical protein HY647_02485, partial [Acidobacteria bacterium]|nr:hypothetical protein [Acidobacteriota bacterium]